MTQIVLNIDDASLVSSLKQILGAIKGVTIANPLKKKRMTQLRSPKKSSLLALMRQRKDLHMNLRKVKH